MPFLQFPNTEIWSSNFAPPPSPPPWRPSQDALSIVFGDSGLAVSKVTTLADSNQRLRWCRSARWRRWVLSLDCWLLLARLDWTFTVCWRTR